MARMIRLILLVVCLLSAARQMPAESLRRTLKRAQQARKAVHKRQASLLGMDLPVGLAGADLEYMEGVASKSTPGSDPFDSPRGKSRPDRKVVPLDTTDIHHTDRRTRKNILHMTIDEQNEFLNAVRLLKEEKHAAPEKHNTSMDDEGTYWNTWDWLAYKHQMVSLKYLDIANGVLFLPWHRAWLLYNEKELQRVSGNANLSIPYWDFSNRMEAWKIFTDPLMGGNGTGPNHTVTNGQFADWDFKVCLNGALCNGGLTRSFGITHNAYEHRRLNSSFGMNTTYATHGDDTRKFEPEMKGLLAPEQKESGTLPSACDVLKTLGTENFYSGFDICKPSFLFGLWYIHRSVHVAIGGDYNLVSADDPLVFLHHAMVDKLFTMWQKAHINETAVNQYGYPEGDLNTELPWVGGTVSDYLYWEQMEYDYEYDDTLDEKFHSYYELGHQVDHMCQGWNEQIQGGGFGRNYSYCHTNI